MRFPPGISGAKNRPLHQNSASRTRPASLRLALLLLLLAASAPAIQASNDSGASGNAAYEIRANLPQTMVYNLSLQITVPAGMIFDASSLETSGASSSQAISISSPNDDSSQVQVAIDFGDVDNSEDIP